jgi:hypothetical protein
MKGRILATLAVVLLGALFASATDTGTISGVVTDPSAAVIPEVAVKAVNTSTGVARTATTNTQGFFAQKGGFPSADGNDRRRLIFRRADRPPWLKTRLGVVAAYSATATSNLPQTRRGIF